MEAYKALEEHFGKLMAFRQIDVLLDWDRSVLMPPEGSDQRAWEAATLNVMMHDMQTAPRVAAWLGAVDKGQLDDWQRANLRLMERLHKIAVSIPSKLVEKKMLQATRTEMVWRQARQDSNFALVADDLSRLVDIVREIAEEKSRGLGLAAYDALMDHYAPGMTSAMVDAVFDDLAVFLPPFLEEVLAFQKTPLDIPGPFPVAVQEKFGRQLAGFLGFDFTWGRLDVSAHPFSMGIGGDVRITTRYNENDFINSIQGVAHEAGHGFYDRYTPQQWQRQPVGTSQFMGMMLHESQSLSIDMQLGRSRSYWDFLSPHLQQAFGAAGPEWSGENLWRMATQVERGFIRVDADEVTYPAHVILRYRLEKALMEGWLNVKDLPEAWNAQMEKLIGVAPPDDRRGCLQDIHWYCGEFGYFPAYALGAMTAAQFCARMRQDIPALDGEIAKGNFAVFTGWLRENVQSKACLYPPLELIEKVCGEKFSAVPFKAHLTQRYLGKDSV